MIRMTRRVQLGLMGAAVVTVPALGATARKLDLNNPKDKLEAYARLRSRSDGKPAFMAYRATIFAKVEGELAVPCFDVEGCAWSKITRIDDAHMEFANVEAGYYLDRATGEPLDVWRNPINGLDCKIKHYRSFQYSVATADATQPKQERAIPGLEYKGVVPPAQIIGDQVWMFEDLFVKMPNKPKESFADPLEYVGPNIVSTSLATWTAEVSDLNDPKMAFVPSTLSYQTLNSWRPFMRMGTTPGVFTWRMQGVKLEKRDGIPERLRARVVKDYPDFFEKL